MCAVDECIGSKNIVREAWSLLLEITETNYRKFAFEDKIIYAFRERRVASLCECRLSARGLCPITRGL